MKRFLSFWLAGFLFAAAAYSATVVFMWDTNAPADLVVSYSFYEWDALGGKWPVATPAAPPLTLLNVTEDRIHTYTVTAVNIFGLESLDSNSSVYNPFVEPPTPTPTPSPTPTVTPTPTLPPTPTPSPTGTPRPTPTATATATPRHHPTPPGHLHRVTPTPSPGPTPSPAAPNPNRTPTPSKKHGRK